MLRKRRDRSSRSGATNQLKELAPPKPNPYKPEQGRCLAIVSGLLAP